MTVGLDTLTKVVHKEYLHSRKENGYYAAEQLGFDEENDLFWKVAKNIYGALYEVEFDMRVDQVTGDVEVKSVKIGNKEFK